MNLTSDKIVRLRAVEPDDVDFMLEVENDSDAWIYGETVAPVSRQMLTDYALSYTANPYPNGQLRLIMECVADSRPVGIVDLYDVSMRHSNACIGIYVLPSCRGKGYGERGIRLMCGLTAETLNIRHILAKIAEDNRQSLALFRTCGFREAGRLPGWLKTDRKRQDLLLFIREED